MRTQSDIAGNSPGTAGAATESQAFQLAIIGTMAFLTVVDLFATQALLPTLAAHYQVKPSAAGLAVNACTLGMAAGGLLIALFGQRIDRQRGIVTSLLILSVPTLLLALAPNLWVFAALRVAQGLCMASAFGLTLAHLGEKFSAQQTANAFAAYITGNVASNLVGRLIAVSVVDHAGLAANFVVFATLNVAGAVLAYATVPRRVPLVHQTSTAMAMTEAWSDHLRQPEMRAAFGIGFCILFAFIGTFTYVNFELVAPPLSVGMMTLGFIYFVFLPSVLTTPLAGSIGQKIGHQRALQLGLGIALAGLPLLVTSRLPTVLLGMTLVAVGTFFAQALATGFVGRAAKHSRSAASGLYLASYFSGGLAGSAVLGQAFDRWGWTACVAGVGMALLIAGVLSIRLRISSTAVVGPSITKS
jgi:MFS transporter, YNFM family, putative membrane transport protein